MGWKQGSYRIPAEQRPVEREPMWDGNHTPAGPYPTREVPLSENQCGMETEFVVGYFVE